LRSRVSEPVDFDDLAAPDREVEDVGGGRPIAWVKDADNNLIGLVQG